MTHTPLEGIEGVIFDLGDTLYSLPIPLTEYHKKFLREVCGDEFQVSDVSLAMAHDVASREVSERLVQANAPANYCMTAEDWIQFDRTLLRELGVTKNLDERGRRYQRLWDKLFKGNPLALKPDAREVLEELNRRGYKLGVATNSDEDPSHMFRASGVLHLFQSIQFTFVRGFCKPSPYMLIMNAYEMGLNPLKCVFVGDSIHKDVEAARRAGMAGVLLDPESRGENGTKGDVRVIRHLRDLLNVIQ